MSGTPAVVVKKGGFFTALFHGVFGLLAVVVLTAGILGFYTLRIADHTSSDLLQLSGKIITDMPNWAGNLPPVLAEALDDHRAPDYRAQLDVEVRLLSATGGGNRRAVVVEVANNGPQTVSVLALNVVVENADGVPIEEHRVYAATPFVIDEDDWRGPLMPGARRKFVAGRREYPPQAGVRAEIAELRIWNGGGHAATHSDSADAATSDDPATAATPAAGTDL